MRNIEDMNMYHTEAYIAEQLDIIEKVGSGKYTLPYHISMKRFSDGKQELMARLYNHREQLIKRKEIMDSNSLN